MVVIRQGNDRVGEYDHSADGDAIERLWETEGLCAVTKAFKEKERKRKREKLEGAAHVGHGAVQLHHHLRHDGHFAPARLKHMRKELNPGARRAKPRHIVCCGDSVTTREPSVGATNGDGHLQDEYCGLQYFGGEEGARRPSHAVVGCPMEQAECFNSSFDLLKIEPRKLSCGGCKPSKPVAARVRSPCLSVESVHTSCGSLSPCSPGRRLTNAKVDSLDHDNIFCDPTTNLSPPSDCPGKVPERKNISAPQHHESSGATYDDADTLSPRHYGLYEMAHVGLRTASQRVATQFRSLGICDEFPDSCPTPAAALSDAHQSTLQKARNPATATRLDNMKASASPELKERLRDLQAQLQDWRPPTTADFNANETVSKFHSMIVAYEKDLETPFQKSMRFCDGLEREFESMESTTRAALAPICSLPREQIWSELHDTNTFARKRVWR